MNSFKNYEIEVFYNKRKNLISRKNIHIFVPKTLCILLLIRKWRKNFHISGKTSFRNIKYVNSLWKYIELFLLVPIPFIYLWLLHSKTFWDPINIFFCPNGVFVKFNFKLLNLKKAKIMEMIKFFAIVRK